MFKSAAACTSIVLCAALLAACGDSGSSASSSSTKTATVPSGKLGAAAMEQCALPKLGGAADVTSLRAYGGVPCGTATEGLLSVFKTNKYSGWDCPMRISGRNVSFTCTRPGDANQYFTGGWRVL